MGNANRGLIALLAVTVAFFALWLVALKPSSSSSSGSPSGKHGLGQFQSDINAAKSVQGTVDKASAAASGNSSATTPSTPAASATSTAKASTTPAATAPTTVSHKAKAVASAQAHARVHTKAHARTHAKGMGVKVPSLATPAARLSAAQSALKAHKVVAFLFYNSAAPDDAAVKQELQRISTHRGAVVKLAIPLAELPSYSMVISQVPVNFSPTLVIVDRAQQAQEITGFADSFEIAQRIDQALAAGTTAG